MPWGKVNITESSIQCSLVDVPVTFLEPLARQKIEVLMGEYHHQEWLAYLVGSISKKKNIFVEDISIPPHAYAYGASAEAEPFHIPESCVGVIHSHHHMGAFHSGTDQSHVDRNFPVSITVAYNGDRSSLVFDAVSCSKTPCGKDTTVKSTVKYVQPPALFDKEEFLKGAKENIDKGKKVYVRPTGALDSPYVPVRYREVPYAVDAYGNVLSKEEVTTLLREVDKDV